ncbi:MAG: hypothetical protein EAZ61_14460, partial [Oscillatoriales cyanobacterium]
MTWDNVRQKQFREALQDVYRSYSALQIFVRDAIDRNLAEIVEQSGLTAAAFKLVEWAQARGQLDRLYAAFCAENDRHPFAISSASTPSSDDTTNSPRADSSPNSGTTINTNGGDYREIHNSDQAQYAEGSIDNRREQQGINGNDGAVINIGTVINNYGNSSETPSTHDANLDTDPPASGISEPNGETPYVSHRAIEDVCQAALTQPGSLVRIKAPHRFGKTELISQLQTFAEGQGYNVVVLDLNHVEAPSLDSLDRFLRWFCKRIARKLRIREPIEEYWDEELGCNVSCSEYIGEAILNNLDEPLVLALDNVDALFEHPAIILDFFKLVRSWYEEARREPEWRKLRQIVAYSTEPYEFLAIPHEHSPLNVGEPIELPAFDRAQVHELVARFGLTSRVDLDQLYTLLDGHPELLQIGLKFLRLDARRSLADLQTES